MGARIDHKNLKRERVFINGKTGDEIQSPSWGGGAGHDMGSVPRANQAPGATTGQAEKKN